MARYTCDSCVAKCTNITEGVHIHLPHECSFDTIMRPKWKLEEEKEAYKPCQRLKQCSHVRQTSGCLGTKCGVYLPINT